MRFISSLILLSLRQSAHPCRDRTAIQTVFRNAYIKHIKGRGDKPKMAKIRLTLLMDSPLMSGAYIQSL